MVVLALPPPPSLLGKFEKCSTLFVFVAESVTELHAPSTALAQAGFSTWHPLHMEHYDDPILAPVDDPEHVYRLRSAGLAVRSSTVSCGLRLQRPSSRCRRTFTVGKWRLHTGTAPTVCVLRDLLLVSTRSAMLPERSEAYRSSGSNLEDV